MRLLATASCATTVVILVWMVRPVQDATQHTIAIFQVHNAYAMISTMMMVNICIVWVAIIVAWLVLEVQPVHRVTVLRIELLVHPIVTVFLVSTMMVSSNCVSHAIVAVRHVPWQQPTARHAQLPISEPIHQLVIANSIHTMSMVFNSVSLANILVELASMVRSVWHVTSLLADRWIWRVRCVTVWMATMMTWLIKPVNHATTVVLPVTMAQTVKHA